MRILVNGAWHDIDAGDVAACLAELGYQAACVATAVNGEFVPVGQRTARPLVDGDRLEVLAPMQGG